MIASGIARPLCIVLAAILGAPFGSAQTSQETLKTAAPQSPPSVLRIVVLEGNNATNSIPLGRSVTPVVEVRDENEFPVEGATVVFTLPASGPGGTFPNGRAVFTARSEAQGQAMAPFTINNFPGKFQIKVAAAMGNRKGEAVFTQTNSLGRYIGPTLPRRSWYKRWPVWVIAGGAVAAGVAAWLVTRTNSSSTPVTITAGGPVFH